MCFFHYWWNIIHALAETTSGAYSPQKYQYDNSAPLGVPTGNSINLKIVFSRQSNCCTAERACALCLKPPTTVSLFRRIDTGPHSASIYLWKLCQSKMAYETNRLQKDERWQRLLLGDWLALHEDPPCSLAVALNSINTLRSIQNGGLFRRRYFQMNFLNVNRCISINISPKFVRKCQINNIVVMILIRAWRRRGDKPFCETIMVSLLHICVTRPAWVTVKPLI